MEWRDQGVVVGVRKHGETSAMFEVLTHEHGRHAGVDRGGVSRKMTPVLQPGNQVDLIWRARLEDHLGSYRVELLKSRSGILGNRPALAALGSICALVAFAFPERMHMPVLYDETVRLIDSLAGGDTWLQPYGMWELLLLVELGYGLDLTSCSATGATNDLIYVSPKSGRAVSRDGAAQWADRLLPLPAHFRQANAQASAAAVLDGLRTTGYFLEHWLAPALGNRPLPQARARLIVKLDKQFGDRENAKF